MGRSKAPSLPIKALSFCRPTELRRQGGAVRHQRGAFPTPAGRLYGFIQTGASYQFIGALQQPSRQRRVKLKPLKNLRPSGPSTLKPAGLVHMPPTKTLSGEAAVNLKNPRGESPVKPQNPHARQGVSISKKSAHLTMRRFLYSTETSSILKFSSFPAIS